jgi:hypothetical protein
VVQGAAAAAGQTRTVSHTDHTRPADMTSRTSTSHDSTSHTDTDTDTDEQTR